MIGLFPIVVVILLWLIYRAVSKPKRDQLHQRLAEAKEAARAHREAVKAGEITDDKKNPLFKDVSGGVIAVVTIVAIIIMIILVVIFAG